MLTASYSHSLLTNFRRSIIGKILGEQINKTDPNDEALEENIKLAIIISIDMKCSFEMKANSSYSV